jgi:SAM-dependent MidA family methyltransferase
MASSWLAEVVRAEGGRVRFDRFMELALYHPERGYYTKNISTVGRTGDFSTTATISQLLSAALANWIRSEAKALGLAPIVVIELGGGTGDIAKGILRRFGPFARIQYHIVEISPPLIRHQKSQLKDRRVRWHTTAESALSVARGRGIVFSNEFVDAFPCRRFARGSDGWAEVFLTLEGNQWREEILSLQDHVDTTGFDSSFGLGQFLEVQDSYRRWLQEFARHLRLGGLLTIDYGGSPKEIYNRRPKGTIRGYFRHERLSGMDIYLRPGLQDLTADVNFDDLKLWAERVGLQTVGYHSQADFLRRWSPDLLPANATEFVADLEGAGTAFKVLHQRKV